MCVARGGVGLTEAKVQVRVYKQLEVETVESHAAIIIGRVSLLLTSVTLATVPEPGASPISSRQKKKVSLESPLRACLDIALF